MNRRFAGAMVVAISVFSAANASGADMAPAAEAPQPAEVGWTFTAAPYVWAAGIEGTVGQFGLPPVEVDASFIDVMKNFDMGFMGAVEGHYDRLGVAMDLQYIKVSTSADTPNGVAADRIDLTSKTLSVFGAGMYRVVDTQEASLDLMLGARTWWVDSELDPVGGLAGPTDFSDSAAWIDPMIGAKGKVKLSQQVYLTGWGLIGGFGVGSELSWDVMGAVGYEVTDRVSMIAGYRALGVDYRDGDFIFQSGPIIGAAIKF
jgi:hypothetical protein